MLPDELWALILSFIHFMQIPKLKSVCKQFSRVIDSEYFEDINLDYKCFKLVEGNIMRNHKKFKENCADHLIEHSIITGNMSLFKRCLQNSDLSYYNVGKYAEISGSSNNVDVVNILINTYPSFTPNIINRAVVSAICNNSHDIINEYLCDLGTKNSKYILKFAIKSGDIYLVKLLMEQYEYDISDLWNSLDHVKKNITMAEFLLETIKSKQSKLV